MSRWSVSTIDTGADKSLGVLNLPNPNHVGCSKRDTCEACSKAMWCLDARDV